MIPLDSPATLFSQG